MQSQDLPISSASPDPSAESSYFSTDNTPAWFGVICELVDLILVIDTIHRTGPNTEHRGK